MAVIIDGKRTADAIHAEVAAQAAALYAPVTLAVVLIGEDPASRVYVARKHKMCALAGIRSLNHALPADINQGEVIALIDRLNADTSVTGILVQHPMPPQIDEGAVFRRINPLKDVDGFHPTNAGLLAIGGRCLAPCTPLGVMELLKRCDIPVAGKRCVVLGRSNIVGKPMAQLLLAANGTVTVCHSKTENVAEIARQADILVAAVGVKGFVTREMVKPGAAVIDVGIHRTGEGKKLCGDVRFDECAEVAGHITPVPGGVGPMTIAMLLKNCLAARGLQIEARDE